MGSSQKASFGYTVSDSGIGYVRDTLNNHYRNDDTGSTKCGGTLYIRRFIYNYKAVGSHRYIELRFDCSRCNYSKWVRTDKTSNGNKNISLLVKSDNIVLKRQKPSPQKQITSISKRENQVLKTK